MAGASDEKLADIWEFRTSPHYSDLEKAALTIAEGMTVTPVDVSEDDFAEARKWFSEAEMVELVGTVAMENYRARFNVAFGIESEHTCEIRGITPPQGPRKK